MKTNSQKKIKYLTSILSLFINFIYSQDKIKILFKDGTHFVDSYKAKGNELKSVTTKERFHIDTMKELTYYHKNDSTHYYVINTKTHKNSKNSYKQLARKVYSGGNINLYYIYENWTSIGPHSTFSYNSYDYAYAQKITDEYAYNIGYIYGAAQKSIKKRIGMYFSDCPDLVSKVKNNKIKKKNSLEIVEYYDKKCLIK